MALRGKKSPCGFSFSSWHWSSNVKTLKNTSNIMLNNYCLVFFTTCQYGQRRKGCKSFGCIIIWGIALPYTLIPTRLHWIFISSALEIYLQNQAIFFKGGGKQAFRINKEVENNSFKRSINGALDLYALFVLQYISSMWWLVLLLGVSAVLYTD